MGEKQRRVVIRWSCLEADSCFDYELQARRLFLIRPARYHARTAGCISLEGAVHESCSKLHSQTVDVSVGSGSAAGGAVGLRRLVTAASSECPGAGDLPDLGTESRGTGAGGGARDGGALSPRSREVKLGVDTCLVMEVAIEGSGIVRRFSSFLRAQDACTEES